MRIYFNCSSKIDKLLSELRKLAKGGVTLASKLDDEISLSISGEDKKRVIEFLEREGFNPMTEEK